MRNASIRGLSCGGNLPGSDFSNSIFSGSGPYHADFRRARREGTHFSSGYSLSSAKFDDAYAVGAQFVNVHLNGANFRRANLANANLSDANLRRADLSEADMTGANLKGAVLSNAQLNGTKLSGADLTGADLFKASFKGVDLRQTKFYSLPNNPVRYDGAGGTSFSTSYFNMGALVLGADFKDTTGITNDTRRYLCKIGGMNVPGGCAET